MKVPKDEYNNGEITVSWNQSKCVQAGVCHTELRKVFDPTKRPWINMLGASTQEIINTVEKCPTGALSFVYNTKPEFA